MLIRDKLEQIVGMKLEHPDREEWGDYSVFVKSKEQAELIVERLKKEEFVDSVEVIGGFVNVRLKIEYLGNQLNRVLNAQCSVLRGKKIMVEYAHPNTHKELHIGHMRTLITGEAISRILQKAGATVFRANYQGDIGPHVAKAIWGTQKILVERKLSWEDAEKMGLVQRAHLLGEGYVRGNSDYENHGEEIDEINQKLYAKDQEIWPVYERTRRWSLEYYDSFYRRFDTVFDKLFFESEVADKGKKIVQNNMGKLFSESEGAIIFDGEKYGLHKRVFVTKAGTPTYEGKDMALAFEQYKAFPFNQCVHVVANEQTGYFQVVIKALELLDEKFKGREFHLSMGMVNLVGRKIASRTGDIVTVDGLLDKVKAEVKKIAKMDEETAEAVTMAAVKYSVLKVDPKQNVAFDIKQSISLDGNSGPYLQYTYARARSILRKFEALNPKSQINFKFQTSNSKLNEEELRVLRWIYRWPEVVEEAAERLAPNLVCNFIYELAQRFNSFYNKHSILEPESGRVEEREFRLAMTKAVGAVLKTGLGMLGIEALEKM